MSPQLDLSEQVLECLHEALKAELTAVYQYLLHAKACQNWGYSRLAEYNRKESLEELQHAEALMERIDAAGGSIEIDTAPGKGTTVRLSLPVRPS